MSEASGTFNVIPFRRPEPSNEDFRVEHLIEDMRARIEDDPYDLPAYHRLFSVYRTRSMHDHAYMTASALQYLGDATSEERAFLTNHASGARNLTRGLDHDEWFSYLAHEDESELVGEVFEHLVPVAQHLAAERADPDEGLPIGDAVEGDVSEFLRVFDMVMLASEVEDFPCVHFRKHVVGNIADVSGKDFPSIAVSEVLLQAKAPEMAFVAARQLSYQRRGRRIMTWVKSVREAKTLFYGALSLAGVMPSQPVVNEAANLICGVLGDLELENLTDAVRRCVKRESRSALGRWFAGAELSSARVGLLFCQDLASAERMLRILALRGVDREDVMDDLLAFSASPAYFVLRSKLGVALEHESSNVILRLA